MGLFSSVKHVVGGLTGATAAHAAKGAAKDQEQAIREAIAQYNTDYAGQQTLFNPYIQAGAQGIQNLNALNSGDYSGFMNSPDYKYALQQGLAGVDSRAGAMGNLFSGSRATALNDKAQGLATQNLSNYRNSLAMQLGLGTFGTGSLSNQLWNKTQGIADARMGVGNAQAGGKIGAANSWGQGASNLLNFASSFWGGGGPMQAPGGSASGYQPTGGYSSMTPDTSGLNTSGSFFGGGGKYNF